ncbi:DUF7768 domain-containing protein [Mobilitalea sibirica]
MTNLFTLTQLCEASHKWVFGGRISEGMAAEILRAKRKRMRIRYFTEDFKEVTR